MGGELGFYRLLLGLLGLRKRGLFQLGRGMLGVRGSYSWSRVFRTSGPNASQLGQTPSPIQRFEQRSHSQCCSIRIIILCFLVCIRRRVCLL